MLPLRRLGPPAALLGALLALAGCGGGTTQAGSGASVVPASAAVYASIATDEGSGQWRQAGELIDRLPGGDNLRREFLEGIEQDADWKTEIAPALGPELVVVALGASNDANEVALTEPDDVEAFDALAAGEGQVTREIDGWRAVADDEATLDRFEDALEDGALADDEGFQQATSGLPENRLVTVYANPEAGLGSAPGPLDERTIRCVTGGEEQQPIAFAISATDGGFRLDAGETRTAFDVASGASDLDDKVPAGALAFASGHDGAAVLRQILDCAGDSLGLQLGQLQAFTGISVEDDLLPLFEGETALVLLHTGTDDYFDPAVTVLTQVKDGAAVVDQFDRHLKQLEPLFGGRTVRRTIDGLDVRTVWTGDPAFSYAAVDGLFAISNSATGLLRVLRHSGPSLADEPKYLDARAAAGVPDETAGFAYVDVAGLGTWAETSKGATVKGLGGLVVWGERDGDSLTTQGFLAID